MQLFIAKWFKSSPMSKGQGSAFCRLVVVHPPMGCGVRMLFSINMFAAVNSVSAIQKPTFRFTWSANVPWVCSVCIFDY